jgi:hypothetical protein
MDYIRSKFLFLDFDGVLNSLEWFKNMKKSNEIILPTQDELTKNINPNQVKLVEEICEKTNCAVIITSVWRIGRNIKELRDLLSACGWRNPIYIAGKTRLIQNHDRGTEIKHYIEKFGIDENDIVILDDDNDMGNLMHRLLQCDPIKGITPEIVQKAIQLLK